MGGFKIILFLIFKVATLSTLEASNVSFPLGFIYPPVVSPMDCHGNLNLTAVPILAKFLKDTGNDGVLLMGTTGEGPTMTVRQRKMLLDAWLQAARPLDLHIIFQVGGMPFPEVQELARYGEKVGVDAIISLPELYYKPENAKQLVYYMELVAKSAPHTPLLYYHYPEQSGVNVDIAEFFRLATKRIPTFKGMKSTVFSDSLSVLNEMDSDQIVFIADFIAIAPAALMGYNSYILTISNLFPELVVDIVTSGNAGNTTYTIQLYSKLMRLVNILQSTGHYDATVKAVMPAVTGIDVGPVRDPIIPITKEQLNRVLNELKEEGVQIKDAHYCKVKYAA